MTKEIKGMKKKLSEAVGCYISDKRKTDGGNDKSSKGEELRLDLWSWCVLILSRYSTYDLYPL